MDNNVINMSERAEIQVLYDSEEYLHIRHFWTPSHPGASFIAIAIATLIISFLFSDWPVTVEDWLWFFGQPAVMLYIVAAFCFNRTDVHADRQRIHWRHLPIPLLPGGTASLDQVHDVFVYRRKKRRYKVALRLKGGAFRIVLWSIHSGAAAQQAAAAIARHAHLPATLP